MNWWCAASTKAWTWSPQIFIGVWLTMGATLGWYFWAVHRAEASGRYTTTRRQKLLFVAGVLVLWVASDWPLGVLGAGYLASAHMFQFVLYSVVSVPLMMMGMPEQMFQTILDKLRLTSGARWLAHPIVAALFFNIMMVSTHAPPATDMLRSSEVGSFVMDFLWIIGAVVLWLPVISPVRSLRMRALPGQMIYLFLAVGIVVIVPSAALIVSADPIYRTYELAPRIFTSWSAVEDQQFAGVIMKLGATPIIWGVILALFIRWTNESGLSNKFGPKYRGRSVSADGSIEPEWTNGPPSRATAATAANGSPTSGPSDGESVLSGAPPAQPGPAQPSPEQVRPEQLN